MSRRFGVTHPAKSPSQAILDQAAHWLVILEERQLSQPEMAELIVWRQQSPEHEQAWQAALRLKGMMGKVPADLAKQVWGRIRTDRRALLKTLAGVAILVPIGKLARDQWPALSADYRTATGEQRTITLADGSRLQLNTATVVDTRFSSQERLIELIKGEILVTTAQHENTEARPLIVQTRAGRIRTLGTRFGVRDIGEGMTQVSVYQHRVAIRPTQAAGETLVVEGKAAAFDDRRVTTIGMLRQKSPAWSRGQIVCENQRLGDFIAELARYRPGILRCAPAVADLRISGVFQLDNTDQILAIVARTLPVKIQRRTDYWVMVGPV